MGYLEGAGVHGILIYRHQHHALHPLSAKLNHSRLLGRCPHRPCCVFQQGTEFSPFRTVQRGFAVGLDELNVGGKDQAAACAKQWAGEAKTGRGVVEWGQASASPLPGSCSCFVLSVPCQALGYSISHSLSFSCSVGPLWRLYKNDSSFSVFVCFCLSLCLCMLARTHHRFVCMCVSHPCCAHVHVRGARLKLVRGKGCPTSQLRGGVGREGGG